MLRDRKLMIVIVIILVICITGLGIAFAAFSQTLTIGGSGTVDASSWSVVFEGADGSNTIGAPTLVGTAAEVTRPTIKNNSTEISTYEVTLKTPGDSVTYNFKIHNKGDYAANLSSLTVSGVDFIASNKKYVNSADLVTDSSVASSNLGTLNFIKYSFYYTSDNEPIGKLLARDCLEPGESENVSLNILFEDNSFSSTLPKDDLILDNLGIIAIYNQSNNGSCPFEPETPVIEGQFVNVAFDYYTYEGKSFIGMGVDNLIISENIIGKEKYASAKATQCSNGSTPVSNQCPSGTTPVFSDHPAEDMAAAYCSGCTLLRKEDFQRWYWYSYGDAKCIGYYNGVASKWWLADYHINPKFSTQSAHIISIEGKDYNGSSSVTNSEGVRPVVSIPSTATMTGSGTKTDPYVITP